MRPRTSHKQYKYYLENTPAKACDFCTLAIDDGQVTGESEHFWIAINLFGYALWDDTNVEKHIMLVPKRHVTTLGELTTVERDDYIKQLALHEDQGYSMYTRATGNAEKSIPHLHTHLMKLGSQTKRVIVRVERPYILWAV